MTAARPDLFSAAADAKGDLSFPATTYPTSTPNPNGINRWDASPGIVPCAVLSQTTLAKTIPSARAVLHRGSELDACDHIYRVSILQSNHIHCAHIALDPVNLHLFYYNNLPKDLRGPPCPGTSHGCQHLSEKVRETGSSVGRQIRVTGFGGRRRVWRGERAAAREGRGAARERRGIRRRGAGEKGEERVEVSAHLSNRERGC
jgi:hypothetical protein